MARYNKKRARELKHDAFRDTTMGFLDRLGDRLEGKGRTLVYAIAGIVLAVALIGLFSWWRNRKADEARLALGKAIEVAESPVTPSPTPGATTPAFASERERSQKAVEEFQKVADKYDDPYRSIARYMAATHLLNVDRNRGLSELDALSKSDKAEVAVWSRLALAQAREADGQHDAAAALYQELLNRKETFVPRDVVSVRLASVYEKQGKKNEAADVLFKLVEEARNIKDKDGKPVTPSTAVSEAAQKLQSLDPERYAKLPPEPPASGLPF